MLRLGARRVHVTFAPRHAHARVAIHSMATVTGAVVAARMGFGSSIWAALAWYCGGFLGFHFVLAPIMALWFMLVNRVERWVRDIVEEELIRFDMKNYERQLQRVLPALIKRSRNDEDEA